MSNGVIISIVNHKGGVSKTTSACNLGHALAREGKKVVVVDMDPQCNSTSILLAGKRDRERRYSLYEILDPDEKENSPEQCVYGTDYNNLYICPNIPETATIEPILISQMPGALYLFRKRFRDFAKQKYDFTIIDNPPNLGIFVISSLQASDFVIVPNQAGSKFSIEGLGKAVKFIEDIRKNGNPDLRFLKLLVTQVDRRMSIHKATITQVRDHFPPEKVFNTVIPSCTDFQKAEMESKTIFAQRSGVSGAVAYKNLAKELIATLYSGV
jgi:cellulose biosynthesis protein BcsQ